VNALCCQSELNLCLIFKRLVVSFSPNFKFKICQKFKISKTKITKYITANYFWFVVFKFLTKFKFKIWWEIGHKFFMDVNFFNIFIKAVRHVSDQNFWGFKWLFGLSWTRYDVYKKYRMCLSSPQTRLKIPCFVNLQGKIKRIDCDSVKINYFPESQ
jgi:hypothetical protein